MPCDYKKYPQNWHSEIRPRILKRAKNKCEQCKIENYSVGARDKTGEFHLEKSIDNLSSSDGENLFGFSYPKIIKIVLTIAHLDHDIKNNDDENLAALCQKCHNNHDKEFRKQNRLKNKRKYQLTIKL